MKKKLGIILGALILIVTVVGGCARVQKEDGDKVYQDAHSKIQKKFSNYVVENYKGVKKIEWQGINIERYDSPIHGRSLFGNVTYSKANIYVTDKQSVRVTFYLSDVADFDQDRKKFVLNDRTAPSNFDQRIKEAIHNATYNLSADEKQPFKVLQKDASGSPGVSINYNLTMHEVK